MKWGLLGPEQLAGARRTRTLDLGAAVRTFNELAVPGLGGVWFAKQIFLATLGVHLADRLRATRPDVRPIKIANTIEALACLCAFKNNKWAADARLRGLQKLPRDGKLTFSRLGLSRFYVTQPMRMATGEALAALGFVAPGSQRFNSFQCAKAGLDLIDAATRCFKPHNGTVEGYLYKCAMARDEAIAATPPLRAALSPLDPLPSGARDIIRGQLCKDAGQDWKAARRENALMWVGSLDAGHTATWNHRPNEIEVSHWDDLRLGALFFRARDAAIDTLNIIEAHMAFLAKSLMTPDALGRSPTVQKSLEILRAAARRFLDERKDPTEGHMATEFCHQCNARDPAVIIRALVQRDNRVLRLGGDDVVPGPAFSEQPQTELYDKQEEDEAPGAGKVGRVPVPDGISSRIHNLYLLNLDLDGQLGKFLNPAAGEAP